MEIMSTLDEDKISMIALGHIIDKKPHLINRLGKSQAAYLAYMSYLLSKVTIKDEDIVDIVGSKITDKFKQTNPFFTWLAIPVAVTVLILVWPVAPIIQYFNNKRNNRLEMDSNKYAYLLSRELFDNNNN